MADKTQIANMALVKLGANRISSITDGTVEANRVEAVFDQVLNEALTAGPEKGWKFAKTSIDISVDATAPANTKYAYRYALPNEFLRVVGVWVGGVELTDWDREGQYLLTNMESAEITLDYIQRITVTGLYPPHFVSVLYMMLAYELAYSVTAVKGHANAILEELHAITMPKAIALDARDQYVQEFSSSWVDAGNNTSTLE